MSAPPLPPLSAPACFVGSHDATRDSARPTPRTLDQCAGMQRSSRARIVPMAAPQPMDHADRIVMIGSALGGLALLVLGCLELLP